jgi:hypothetical protein
MPTMPNIGPTAANAVGDAVEESSLAQLREQSFIEVFQSAKCGELAWLACLCNPRIRAALVVIRTRFTPREMNVLFREVCGCAVSSPQPPAPTQPTSVVPAVYTPPVSPPVVQPEQPQPAQPVGNTCPGPGVLTPPGYWTGGEGQ